jgi:hypothetical protein
MGCIRPAAQREIVELANRSNSNWMHLSSRAEENFAIGGQNLKLIQPRSENFWNLRAKVSQID